MSAPASGGAFKRKFDSSSKPSSSHKGKGGDGGAPAWKKPRTGSDGKPQLGWKKKAEWKAGAPKAYTRKDRDEMRKERKAQKPNADIIAEANKIWQVSFTQMSSSERSAKIDTLLATVSGKIAEVGLKHDASRAIQIAIKHADEVQKHKLIKELTGHFRTLAGDHYGHYIVIKMLSNDTRKGDAKKICLTEFKGHVNKLSSHPDSAKVLDYLFASVKAREQNSLLQEFYSPEFVVFANDDTTKDKSLGELLALKPEKKSQILDNLRKYLDKSLEKSMLMFRFVHALLLQYLSHAPLGVETSAEFVPNLHQFIPALHHSVDGCRIICHMLSVGTSAKERKNILKYFKGIVPNMSERAEGVWVLNCALDVVDDTVLLDKVIFAELLPAIKEQLLHQYSSKIYMHVLNSHDAAIFSPNEQDNYSLSGKWILNQTEAASRPQGPLSKKDPKQKRLELINCFLQPLLQTLATLPDTLAALLRSNTGHHLVLESIREAWRLQHDPEAQAALTAASSEPAKPAAGKKKKGAKGAAAAAPVKEEGDAAADDEEAKPAAGEEDEAAAPAAAAGSKFPAALAKKIPDMATNLGYIFTALVGECAHELDPTDASSTDARGAKVNLLEDRFGHYVIKRLLSALEPPAVDFVSKLVSDAFEPQLLVLATTNRPAFVLSAVLENPQLASQAAQLKAKLKPLLPQIIAASSSAPVVPVAKKEAADEDMEDGDAKPAKFVKKNAPTYSAHSTTNAGVNLLSKLMQGLPTDKHPSATGKKGAAASANTDAAAATPATPAAKPTGAAAKSAKKASAAAAVEEEPVKMEDDSTADAPAPAVAPSPARTHRRQWTHTDLDGSKSARLRRSVAPAVPEGDEEPEAAPVAKTPAKAKATPAKKATAKKSAKKPASAEDMDE